MNKFLKILIIILVICLLAVIAGSFYLSSYTVTGTRQSEEEAKKWQSEHYDISYFDKLHTKEYTIKGYQDYVIHAQYVYDTPSDKFVIISHGYTDNRYGDLKYVDMYIKRGYNCIIYDLRGHGKNKRVDTTYGIEEAKDLMKIINDTKDRYGKDITLGIHGESLGAATTLTSLQYKPDVDFVVADCPFADIMGVLKTGAKNMNIPPVIFDAASIANKIHYGYSFNEMQPIKALKDNKLPIMFIHGAKDTFITPDNSTRLSKASKGYSEVHFIKNAAHAMSAIEDHKLYSKYLNDYLDKLGC